MKIENNKKLILMQVIFTVVLLLFVVGISYAVFNFLGGSTSNNTIGIGQISMSYQEPSSIVELNNAVPTSDEEGKVQTSYFEFTVTSHATTNTNDINGITLPYEINISSQAIDEEYEQLSNEYVKLYLSKINNSIETEVVAPTLVSELETSTLINTNNKVYETSNRFRRGSSEVVEVYRLRAWLDESFDSSQSTQYEYRFRVNVNSGTTNVEDRPPVTDLACFAYTENATEVTIYDYKCYEGNSYNLTTETDVTVPAQINGKPVILLAKALEDRGIENTIIPDTITPVADTRLDCFAYTETSTEVTITNFNFTCQQGNNKVTDVIIPNKINNKPVTILGFGAFNHYHELNTIILPNTLITIEADAFIRSSIRTIIIPLNVTSIGFRAFAKGDYTFESNYDLTTIINQTGRTFNWGNITGGTGIFITGIVTHSYGNITVTDS